MSTAAIVAGTAAAGLAGSAIAAHGASSAADTQAQAANNVAQLQHGDAQQAVYEVSCTDPIPWHFIDAYLQADGFTPTDRLTRQLAKEA